MTRSIILVCQSAQSLEATEWTLGVLVTKEHGSAFTGSGRLDLICERGGRALHVEAKSGKGKRPDPIQRFNARTLIRHGMTCLKLGGLEDVDRVVELAQAELIASGQGQSDVEAFTEPPEKAR
jgi:hypothetical protein